MTATAALTTDLQRQVLVLESDLRDRLAADSDREGEWKREHHRAVEQERTAAPWLQWRDDRITQAAVAWVLTTVFLRFCEDNGLLRPVWITGPGSRRQEALDAQKEFFRHHPEDTGREWLLDAIGYLANLPATRGLVESHSALHLIAPSGDAATPYWSSGGAAARTAAWSTTWPTWNCLPGSSATCTRTCPSTPRTPTRCCRPRCSWRSSSSTGPWNPHWPSDRWTASR